jgi:hypothetical protein
MSSVLPGGFDIELLLSSGVYPRAFDGVESLSEDLMESGITDISEPTLT